MKKAIAFLYRWTQLSTGMWYEGSRTAVGCHPNDGYICSSKLVKPMILENPTDWVRNILVIGEPAYIRKLESARLSQLDAKHDPMSYNKSNARFDPANRRGRKESDITRSRKSDARLGDKNPMYGLRGELSPHYGKKYSADRRKNQSEGVTAYASTRPDSHNKNISKALKGNPKVGRSGPANPAYGKTGMADHLNGTSHHCEHCNRTIVGYGNFKRWHGDNCKHKKIPAIIPTLTSPNKYQKRT
jgi:NUMOD3 motif